MSEVFHKGEIAVQKRAGVDKMAARIGGSIRPFIHPVARNFLRALPFVVAASTDADGRVWASLLTGEPGFIEVPDERTVRFETARAAGDVLLENLRADAAIGLLGIEFETRLRMRLNGRAEVRDDFICIDAREVFSNCQKYIQARTLLGSPKDAPEPVRAEPVRSRKLSQRQTGLIRRADTFFIASRNAEKGADASHRGGNPGFAEVPDRSSILFPDYTGNMMFQTLGNLQEDPACGLLFVDFESGDTLQMTGRAEIVWDEAVFKRFQGAERAVLFRVGEVRETVRGMPFEWEFREYSPANPG